MAEGAVDVGLVRALQERAARALPPLSVTRTDGWWLRYAPGCSWWVGSVLPHAEPNGVELADLVARAERFYAARGATVRFQICPPACPDELDGLLADRGYRWESPMSLRIASTEREQHRSEDRDVRLEGRPSRAWFDAASAVHGHTADPEAEWELLRRVTLPTAYASVLIDGGIVAVGRAVVDAGWAGVFGMGTLPEARGRGRASAVLAALAGWARARGAARMYLQVERDNAAATALYRRSGFTELTGYHYRSAG